MVASEIFSAIEIQMSLLLFLALAGYLIAFKINQSAVIGEIIVGLIVGPSLLGLITYTEFVNSLAHLGAVILLFVVGLEFKLHEIFKIKYGLIAASGIIVPWVGGYFLSNLFGFNFSSAVFVGTALTATSIAITANVLREMGKLQTETAKTIIGAAVIDDVLGLLALSISGGIVTSTISSFSILVVILKSFGFLVGGIFLGSYISRFMLKIDQTKTARHYPEFVFIFAMMVAFIYAVGAELIGLSAIVGSFIAGVSLEGVGLRHSKNFKEGAEYLHIIFASIFFISLGIIADLRALTFTIFWFAIALTVIAVMTKVVGCGLSARLQGLNLRESLVVGFGMSPRAEVAMIIGLIALNKNIIGQSIYVSLVLMSLLTTIITPLILKNWLYKEETKSEIKFKFRNRFRII